MTNEVKLEMRIGKRNPKEDGNLLNFSHRNVLNVIFFFDNILENSSRKEFVAEN